MKAKTFLIGGIGLVIGGMGVAIVLGGYCEKIEHKKKRYEHYYNFLFNLTTRNKKISNIFEVGKVHNVAIYGYGNVAEIVKEILEENNIHTKYFIDKRAEEILCEHKVVSLEVDWMKVDAIIVVPYDNKGEISALIKSKVDYLVIPLDKMLDVGN